MLQAVLDLITSERFDGRFLLLGGFFAVVSAVSALALADRIGRTRQVPYAFSRIVVVLVAGIGTLVAQVIVLGSFDDAHVFATDANARVVGWLIVAVGVLAAGVFRSDEENMHESGPLAQLFFFAFLTMVLHQFSVLPRFTDEWTGTRIGVAAVTVLASIVIVLPFLHLFARRALADMPALLPGVVLGLATYVPFALGTVVVQAEQGFVGDPLSPEQLDGTRSLLVTAILFTGIVHAVGWVMAWRASVRSELARREVRVLEASLDALLDDSPDWVSVLDEEGVLLASGGHWKRGPVSHRLRAGESIFTAFDRELAADLRTFLDDARRTPCAPVTREIRYRSPTGVAETTELRIIDRTTDPQVRGVILVARSRTEQIEREDELQNQRRIYQETFQRAPLPMFIVDAVTHRFVDLNPAVLELYGYTREELVDRDAEFLVAAEQQDTIWAFREAIHRGDGDRGDLIVDHVKADGSRFQARVTGTQFREGGALRRLVMVEDVSSFVREGALRSGEIRLLQTLARSEDIASYLEAMVDWLADFPLGESQFSVLWIDADGPIVAQRGLAQASVDWLGSRAARVLGDGDGGDAARCVRLGEGDAEKAWVLPVHDSTGSLIGAVGTGPCAGDEPAPQAQSLLEIAARLTALAAEREVNGKVLQHAQRMETLGRVAGGVAHDFNNLLTVILGEADLLREVPELDEESRSNVDNIMESATRASTIARRLLSMSRNQPQRQDQVALNDVLADADHWMTGVLGESLELEVVHADARLVSQCDRSLLESSLLNLVINARDAMSGAGAISMSLASESIEAPLRVRSGTLAPGDYAVFRIRDRGPGIDDEALPRVLDPFFTTKAGAGTGLGLPMVANFATDNGGALDIRNHEDGGVEVRLWLPLLSVPRAVATEARSPDAGKVRILVVEDEPLVGKFVTRSLTRSGYEVDLLETADAACERLAAGADYDLVLSDIGLPGRMDGIDLARWIAAERPELRVLLSSGYASDGLADDVRATMLPKPYDARTLAQTITDVLAAEP